MLAVRFILNSRKDPSRSIRVVLTVRTSPKSPPLLLLHSFPAAEEGIAAAAAGILQNYLWRNCANNPDISWMGFEDLLSTETVLMPTIERKISNFCIHVIHESVAVGVRRRS
jgi:hypothetical protein